ncbi:DUF2157 domain-containing protein [Muricauda sp. JGD-17]|uniref:DUF2157 domain-containing protein n=1 Tax=Flagellimonas ochracea TaxID=2696472 RepID=A0A964TBA7_9FLAO|nr:DUF2157 domain-containing protein [Allomuricauda ochracea]NAY91697.1 DUF2157 domain-containing protein [Allomuricauda ochracea]
MPKITREDIQIITKHSNWPENSVAKALKNHVYTGKKAWHRFISLFLLVLGVSFTVLGIIFFFAYNWDKLHKFIKIGILEGLVIIGVLGVLVAQRKPLIQRIILTATTMLVGVLYAVFGQVYQTGANAYDFFLGWTLFVTVWAIVSNFPPLWVIYIALVNITVVLYAEQVANDWSEMYVFALLFTINVLFLVLFLWLPKFLPLKVSPVWFTNVLALTAIAFSTIGIIKGIGRGQDVFFNVLLIMTPVVYGLGIWYGLVMKRGFYLAIVPFSIIIIISAFLLNESDDAGMLLTIGVFIVTAVTFLIRFLNQIQKKWAS